MNPLLRSALCLALSVPLAAQDEASSLLAATRHADVIVRATVVAATDPSPEWHRLAFHTDQLLQGSLGATFELLEPAGACCGRSLFALEPGQHCLLLLRRTGAVLHPFGGARGVLADEPALVAAVQELLAAADDAERARRLVAQLAHAERRVADDAAHALATLPSLSLAASDRVVLAGALDSALQQRATRAAPLLDALVRLQDPALLDQLLPTYLAATHDDQARLLRQGLGRADVAMVTERLGMFVGADEQRQLRAVALLADLPATATLPLLQALLTTTACPRVKLGASEALLANGLLPGELAPFVPAPILQFAERRRTAPRAFRSIQP